MKYIKKESFHNFSLIAIKNPNGKYLQRYDERWKCWLFPYIRSVDENKANVDNWVSTLLGTNTMTEYVTNAKHCKFSVSGEKYCWMSIEEMENDKIIMEKNDDIVAFVKVKCD